MGRRINWTEKALQARQKTAPKPRRRVTVKQGDSGPTFDSAWEAVYAGLLDGQLKSGHIKAYWHHPTTYLLPGGVRYTPDFLVQYPDGLERRLQYVEVKGWSKNRRDGVTRYKITAGLFPCFDFIMVEKQGAEWVTIG